MVLSTITEASCAVGKLISHYSSWWRLKRAIAWILRVKNHLMSTTNKRKGTKVKVKAPSRQGPLTVEQLNGTEMEIVQYLLQLPSRNFSYRKRKTSTQKKRSYLQAGSKPSRWHTQRWWTMVDEDLLCQRIQGNP